MGAATVAATSLRGTSASGVRRQCCGEGTVFFATVCSRESGCCPGAYSGRPQCFDQGSSQCCGVSSNDMPLVCGLDVTCPPPDQYRQCPATGGAATVANNSSAAELGEQP